MKKITAIFFIMAAACFASCYFDATRDNPNDPKSGSYDGVTFKMVLAPGGTFPTGSGTETTAGSGTATDETVTDWYWICETEVTYELWYTVYTWATNNSIDHDGDGAIGDDVYIFSNAGREGNDGTIGAAYTNEEPVTTVNWRDCMIWCNALTEWYNEKNGTSYSCVYYIDSSYTTPHRSSVDGSYGSIVNSTTGSFDAPYVKSDAKGFRLLTSMEWECAARYRDGINWTAGTYASGATADYNNGTETQKVAWYNANSSSITHVVRDSSKNANGLGLYDMSGNVWEFCFDWHPSYVGSVRVVRGGGWGCDANLLRVGGVYDNYPYYEDHGIGFRFGRNR